jgi:hypothetical protein
MQASNGKQTRRNAAATRSRQKGSEQQESERANKKEARHAEEKTTSKLQAEAAGERTRETVSGGESQRETEREPPQMP